MKKLIFLSVLVIFLSCKKAEDAQVDSVAIEGVQNEIELPEYSLIEEKDISVRTQMEDDAPLNKRILYKYVVYNYHLLFYVQYLTSKNIHNLYLSKKMKVLNHFYCFVKQKYDQYYHL